MGWLSIAVSVGFAVAKAVARFVTIEAEAKAGFDLSPVTIASATEAIAVTSAVAPLGRA
jgi:hypothetical protein